MKNADKESQKRYTSVVASRAPGTEGQNEPAQPGGLDGKKNSGQRRSVFFLTPFMELTRHWTSAPVRELTRVNCTPKFVVSKAVEAYDGATRGRIQSS